MHLTGKMAVKYTGTNNKVFAKREKTITIRIKKYGTLSPSVKR